MNLAALKFRDFRIYLLGNIFALNGLWMQRLTIGWIAWDLTGSASFVGLVAFVNFVPTIIAGLDTTGLAEQDAVLRTCDRARRQ